MGVVAVVLEGVALVEEAEEAGAVVHGAAVAAVFDEVGEQESERDCQPFGGMDGELLQAIDAQGEESEGGQCGEGEVGGAGVVGGELGKAEVGAEVGDGKSHRRDAAVNCKFRRCDERRLV